MLFRMKSQKQIYSIDLRITAGSIAIATASATRSYTHLQSGTIALSGHSLGVPAFMLARSIFALASALNLRIYVT